MEILHRASIPERDVADFALIAQRALFELGTRFATTEAKNRFGELLEAAHREPVGICKKGRTVAPPLLTPVLLGWGAWAPGTARAR